jgi:hypothetical protein
VELEGSSAVLKGGCDVDDAGTVDGARLLHVWEDRTRHVECSLQENAVEVWCVSDEKIVDVLDMLEENRVEVLSVLEESRVEALSVLL